LEDETGRVKLVGNTMDAAHFVTGILAAVRGKQIESGDFEVYEFFPADIPPQQPLPTQKTSANRYVALVSGLNIGSHDSNPLLPQLLSDYISGHAGSLDEEGFVATITRLIIAGNSFCSAIELPGGAKLRDTTKVC
jgi:DNA polymerase delta subunit 2